MYTAKSDTLSLNDYVRLSIKNNPQYAISQSLVDANRASRQAVLSQLLPQISGSANISRSETWEGMYNSTIRLPEVYDNSATAGISGQLLVFDFGKTLLHYKATGKAVKSSEFDMLESIAAIILNAKTAYFNYLLSVKLLSVNEDALKQANEHLKQAKSLFEVGDQAKIVVTNAMVDVSNADVNVIHAKNTVLLSKIQLETISATKIMEPLLLSDSLNGVEDSIGENEVEKIALESRPEILSARAKLEGAKINLTAAKAAYYPTVNVSGNFNWAAQDYKNISRNDWTTSPNWNIGATATLPLFEGGALYAQVAQAKATVMQSQAQLNAVTLNVTQEIQQYYLQENDARQRIKATTVVINQANENLELTQGRYKAGLTTSVEITDAEYTLANAQTNHAQALFDYHVAHANLLLAMGRLEK